MTFVSVALPRAVAVGLAWMAGTALNAALSVHSFGYALFGLAFIAIAVLTWKLAGR